MTNRKGVFDKVNLAISGCDYATAVSVLVSMLTTVVTLGPGNSPEDVDANINQISDGMKLHVRKNWPERERQFARVMKMPIH